MKNINRITTLNIVSTVLLQGIAFFTTPIFTRMLGTSQYGVYSVFNSWNSVLICVLGLGVSSSLATGLYQFKSKYYEFRSSILVLGSLISIGMILVGMIFSEQLGKYLGYSRTLVIVLFISAFAHYIVKYAHSAYIYEKKAGCNFALSLGLAVTTTILSLYLIMLSDKDRRFEGRVYGMTMPYVIAAIILWGIIFFKKPTGIHWNYSKYGFAIGLPFVFHTLAHNVLSQSDRVMMQNMGIASSEIGIYSLYYSFVAVLSMLLSALNTSWCPFYYDDLDTQDWERLRIKCVNYIELFTVLTIGFLLLSREVGYLLAGADYWGGMPVIPILTLAVYFTFMYQFAVNFEFFHKKTNLVALGTIAAAILNITLNAVLIRPWGMYGAAIATMISYAALFLFHYMVVTHAMKQKFHLKVLAFLPALMAIGVAIALFYFLENSWYIRWCIGGVIGCMEIYRIRKRHSIF